MLVQREKNQLGDHGRLSSPLFLLTQRLPEVIVFPATVCVCVCVGLYVCAYLYHDVVGLMLNTS